MAMTKKIITAGCLVRECIYPRINRSDSDKVRAQKRKATSLAQQKMNDKLSYQKLEMILAANFVPGDIVGCLTFAPEALPESREQVRRILGKFRTELAALWKSKGLALRMAWAIEHLHGSGRWHIHFVCNGSGRDYSEIIKIWHRGEVELSTLRVDREKNYETLARYMAKEERDRVGLRSWSYSRSCLKPEVETLTVPDDTRLDVPEGAVLFESMNEQREWGRFEYIKYAYTVAIKPRRRAKIRRRH